MRKLTLMAFFGLVLLLVPGVLAIEFTDWKQVEVNESDINITSDTFFTVMVPPGYIYNTMDAPIGPVTSFVNASNPNSLITVMIIDNPIGQKLNDKNSKTYLENFLTGANIIPANGVDPQYLNDGGIMTYGTRGDDVAGVYILSTDEKVMIVTGFYSTTEEATAGVEKLALIAATIDIILPDAE
jgi:hypothetical protein